MLLKAKIKTTETKDVTIEIDQDDYVDMEDIDDVLRFGEIVEEKMVDTCTSVESIKRARNVDKSSRVSG